MNRVLAVACLLAFAGGAQSAVAHAMLKTADPAAGSTVASPPQVTLGFSEDVEAAFSHVVIQDAKGHEVQTGAATLVPGAADHLTVGLKALPPGAYKVIWHATATDTHKTQGSFVFTVKP